MNKKYHCLRCDNLLKSEDFEGREKNGGIIPRYCLNCREIVAEENLKERKKEIKKNLTTHLTISGIPPKYVNCTFENYQTNTPARKDILLKVQNWVRNGFPRREGLFMTGNNGSGKTHLSVAAMREIMLEGNANCKFVKIPDLLLQIRECINSDFPDAERTIIDKYLNYKLLVLDDLGVEKITDWSLQTLYLIIDGREAYMQPTIITSNLTLQGIENKISSRIASRITGMCRLMEVKCGDWRLEQRVKKVRR